MTREAAERALELVVRFNRTNTGTDSMRFSDTGLWVKYDDVLRALEALPSVEEWQRATAAAIVATVGGMVEGHPTSAINYLQRLRELVATEARAEKAEAERAEFVRLWQQADLKATSLERVFDKRRRHQNDS